MIKRMLFCFLCLLGTSSTAQQYGTSSINASHKHTTGKTPFTLSIVITQPSKAVFQIYDQNLNLVYSKKSNTLRAEHLFSWDYTRQTGEKVPDGLYFYRIEHSTDTGLKDSCNFTLLTGGFDVAAYWPKFDHLKKQVTISLVEDALVQVRAKDQTGTVIDTILNWQPLSSGSPVIKWKNLEKRKLDPKQITFDVKAIKLPDNYLLLNSNKSAQIDYSQGEWIKHAALYNSTSDKITLIRNNFDKLTFDPSDLSVSAELEKDDGVHVLKKRLGHFIFNLKNFNSLQKQNEGLTYFVFINGEYIEQPYITQPQFTVKVNGQKLLRGKHRLDVLISLGTRFVAAKTVPFIIR